MKTRSRDGMIVAAVIVATAARESGLLKLVCDHFTGSPSFGETFSAFLGSLIAALFAWGLVKRPPPVDPPHPQQ